MQLNSNMFFELAILPVDIVLFCFLLKRKGQKTAVADRFRLLTLAVIISDLIEITVFSYSGILQYTPLPVKYILVSLYLANVIFIPFTFAWYVLAYVENRRRTRRAFIIYTSCFAVFLLILVQNAFTHNLFSVDENGIFVPGSLHAPAMCFFGLFYTLISAIIIFRNREFFKQNQMYSLVTAFSVLSLFFILNSFIGMQVFLLYFVTSVALMIMFLSIEATDYIKLTVIMQALERSREEEAAAKEAAIEANKAKTQFLSQMSHEIKTPVNAIMGYTSLIMEDTEEPATREYSRKSKLAARRLLDFFETVFDFISAEEKTEELIELEKDLKTITDESDEKSVSAKVQAESLKILVVDDTEMNVDLLTRMLEAMGFQTDTAPDGEKAIAKIRAQHYDLIFMDHMMPVMDGMEAMEIIKAEGLCKNVPVVMVTANTIKGQREKYLAAGFCEYIPKPFSENSIREALVKLLPVDEEQLRRVEWPEEWRTLHKLLPFLRISAAKEYCMSDDRFFREILRSYVIDNVLFKLEECIENGDYFDYHAYLCSLRDTSALIGADKVYDKASSMEKYYEKGNFEEIKIKHVALIEETKKLIKQLTDSIFSDDREVGEASVEELESFDIRPVVLVVDDEKMVSVSIEKVLSKYYRVIAVKTGEEGIIKAQEFNPALILLDICIGGMNGYEVYRALKSVEDTSEIPVIFMTSDENGEAESTCLQLGAEDFIRKPFTTEILIKRVRRIIELSGLQKHLRHEISRHTDKVAHLSREVMLALSKAVDAKDRYTNDHSQRVAKYSAELARQLGKSRSEQDDMYIMGLLHDVGKIGVNEEIINKPSRLTAEEYDQVKRHTVIGYDILKVVTEMPDAAKAARWHHERYDGGGYPDGLHAKDIPEEARIICVADSYDAMTSRRPYQDLRPQSEVREEIIRCRGTQFDPMIADAMIRIIDADTDYRLHE